MSMSQSINKVFKEPLLERGFMKSGNLYYRLNGNCLQGILFDQINPFIVRIASFPYWMYSLRGDPNCECTNDIQKGWWAQSGSDISGAYYKKGNEEEFESVLLKYLDKIIDIVIPYLDKMYDEKSSLDVDYDLFFNQEDSPVLFTLNEGSYSQWPQEIQLFWRPRNSMNPYLFLYLAREDGSFDRMSDVMNKYIEKNLDNTRRRAEKQRAEYSDFNEEMRERIEDHAKMMLAVCPKEYTKESAYEEAVRIWGPRTVDVEGEVERDRKNYSERFAPFLDAAKSNDFSSFEKVYEEQCVIMKKALLKKLQLTVE